MNLQEELKKVQAQIKALADKADILISFIVEKARKDGLKVMLSGEGADADKDERVSLLEAFSYARLEVERLYSRDNRLLTEHALLDDDGDGEGSMEPGLDAGDGRLASRFFLAAERPAVTEQAAGDPELAALLEQKRSLENAVADLSARKDDMDPGAYETELEALLLELAYTNRAIRERGDRP